VRITIKFDVNRLYNQTRNQPKVVRKLGPNPQCGLRG
jgi:hypothetical protein